MIFPTLWEYLRSLGIDESNVYFLGLCISAVTVTDMFVGLFIGRLLDKFPKVLPLILVLNLFQITGSFLYFIGNSPTLLIISRLVEGLGNGAYVAFTTDVCRTTTLEERTPVLLFFNVAQQIGLLLGPACNLFLREIDFYIGSIHVNKLNAPGLFLVVLYILFEILACFMYYDLKKAKEEEEEDTTAILNDDNDDILNEQVVDAAENVTMSQNDEAVPWSRYASELIRGEIIGELYKCFVRKRTLLKYQSQSDALYLCLNH